MEAAYNSLKELKASWEKFKSEHETSNDLDFDEVKHDNMVDCNTPFCIRTKK